MQRSYGQVKEELRSRRRTWLVTGAAGFIGSNLVQALLDIDQRVIGLDNFATGNQANLSEVRGLVGDGRWSQFTFIEGDIRDLECCRRAVSGVDVVLHQAALGSVPRSLVEPLTTNAVNVDGFLNVLTSAKDAGVRRFVYAASSSTYGDEPNLPKVEDRIGSPLSPYAVSKLVNELYADVFARCYEFRSIGLRYFNVFGPRQDPEGAYAAVIPKWTAAMIAGHRIVINGDGETTRDFCFVENAVQANLLAAMGDDEAQGRVYNVAVNARTTLTELFGMLRAELGKLGIRYTKDPEYGPPRPGDVRHSQADISRAQRLLGYQPTHTIEQGLRVAMPWYVGQRTTHASKFAGQTAV